VPAPGLGHARASPPLITLARRPAAGPRGEAEADRRRGESFKVALSNGDCVQVSPPVAAEFKGDVPVIQTGGLWLALKPQGGRVSSQR
jgi:hypothetical protein